jgi:hypothetical protein
VAHVPILVAQSVESKHVIGYHRDLWISQFWWPGFSIFEPSHTLCEEMAFGPTSGLCFTTMRMSLGCSPRPIRTIVRLFVSVQVPNEMSIELSWEEVRPYICKYFDILEEESRVARYTGNAEGLSSNRYNCIFFVARLGHAGIFCCSGFQPKLQVL